MFAWESVPNFGCLSLTLKKEKASDEQQLGSVSFKQVIMICVAKVIKQEACCSVSQL